jgi:FixJ family two-component response regulator
MDQRPYIVIVDDDPSVCKALGRLLRTSRMEVETYSSGDRFLRSLARRQPDCLILDIRMPGMTGPELRQRLLNDGYRIPIVFITAHSEEVVMDPGAPDGGADVLLKPFDNQALLDAIQSAMRRIGPP